LSVALAALGAQDMAALMQEGDALEGAILGAAHVPLLKAQLAGGTLSDAPLAPPPLRNDCFALPPGVNWQPVDEALALLRANLHPVAAIEQQSVMSLRGRILARDVAALRPNPPLPNTAVDGFGFAHAALGAPPHVLPLMEGRAAAGLAYDGTVPHCALAAASRRPMQPC